MRRIKWKMPRKYLEELSGKLLHKIRYEQKLKFIGLSKDQGKNNASHNIWDQDLDEEAGKDCYLYKNQEFPPSRIRHEGNESQEIE